MSPTPEELAMIDAFIDKELDGPEAERIARAIEGRADLKAYAERQRRLKARLDDAFADLAVASAPESLINAVRRSPMSIAGGRSPRDPITAQAWRALPIAAAVLLSLGVGLYLGNGASRSLIGIGADGTATADGALAAALTSQLAADDRQPVAIGLSFQSKDGRMCRTFATRSAGEGLAGIACRRSGGWAIVGLADIEGASTDPAKFNTAGAALPQSLRDRVGTMIKGEVFDASQERAARDRSWRRK
jgi:hypothetical protein